jgi:hypothetical protein
MPINEWPLEFDNVYWHPIHRAITIHNNYLFYYLFYYFIIYYLFIIYLFIYLFYFSHQEKATRNQLIRNKPVHSTTLPRTQSSRVHIPTWLPTYLPTFLPTFLPTYIPTYLPTFLPTFLPTCKRVGNVSASYVCT